MSEGISSDPSRDVCRRPEDDEPEAIPTNDTPPAPACRDRLVSMPPVDWDKIPTSCDANAADASTSRCRPRCSRRTRTAGVQNSDGSVGANAGVMATAWSGEVTINHSGWSVTGGVSVGIGAEAHWGLGDADGDRKPEICARVAFDVGIVGPCVEVPLTLRP